MALDPGCFLSVRIVLIKQGQKATFFHPELKQEREEKKHVKKISMEESFEISDDLLIQAMKKWEENNIATALDSWNYDYLLQNEVRELT